MQMPLQVTFRNMDRSSTIEAAVRERAEKLETFHPAVTGCHVIVEARHRHHRQGALYHVRIVVTVPGHELVVSRDPGEHHAHEDVYVAIRDAFDAARRELEDDVRIERRQVKAHAEMPVARVARLFPDDGYGFLAAPDGHEVYFHRNSVVDGDFAHVQVGDEVRFVEEAGMKGPQASTVHLVHARGA